MNPEGHRDGVSVASDMAHLAGATPAQVAASLGSRPLLEALPECVLLVGADGRILYANLPVEILTGFSRQELTGKAADLLIASELLERDTGVPFESICRRADGGEVPVTVNIGRLQEDGPAIAVVVLNDATQVHTDRNARFESEAKYHSLVEQIPGVVYLDPIDEDRDSIYVSPQVETLLGVSQSDWLADPYCWSHHLHPDDLDRVWQAYLNAYRGHITLEQEYRMISEDGSLRWVLELANSIDDEQGRPWLFQGVILDITQRHEAEEQAVYLAYHDELTDLPNRRRFEELLTGAVADATRTGEGVGVVVLDLDNFGFINESLGYEAGDALLAELAGRLLRAAPEGSVIARQGGDKFLVFLKGHQLRAAGPDNAPAIGALSSSVASIERALENPFDVDGVDLVVGASTGYSLLHHDTDTAQGLMRNADTAMHEAKRRGPGSSVLFARSDEDPKEKLHAITRLRHAVESEQWVLYYQPVVDMQSGSVEGVEALIRWQEPDGRIISPGEFIPLAEELGLIEAIGDWVIREIATQQSLWKAEDLDLSMGFNLSLRQFRAPALAERILEALEGAKVDPRSIVLEVTESVAMADPDRTKTILDSLHAAGLEVAIDDFGTGYSSLSRLRHMPVNVLKIDQSFVRDVDTDLVLAGMVRAMIQLAQSLGMASLAEGIETPGELAFLRANGCRLGQGFLMSKPVPASQIPELVRREGGIFPPESDASHWPP